VSVTPFGFSAATFVNGTVTGDDAYSPQTTNGAVFIPTLDVQNGGDVTVDGTATFALAEQSGGSTADNSTGAGGGVRAEAGGGAAAKAVVTVSVPFTIPPHGFVRLKAAIVFGSDASPIKLWNVASAPPLYVATATLTTRSGAATALAAGHVSDRMLGANAGQILDQLSVRVGVRSALFDAHRGFLLNGVAVKIKGMAGDALAK
jgi:hypothetical protein